MTNTWKYRKGMNKFKHTWEKGDTTLSMYVFGGKSLDSGWKVEVKRPNRKATKVLTNGLVSKHHGLILADRYMSGRGVSAFMKSDCIESSKGPQGVVRQDEWLDAHKDDYKFTVIDIEEVNC